MSTKTLSLNGEWSLLGSHETQTIAIDALVPGHVHVDLEKAGVIPDPLWRDQAEKCQWVEDWDWTYSKEFEIGADFDLNWAVLKFDGLDTYAEIKLNGETIGHTKNMFVPHTLEVGNRLRMGKNKVQVNFEPYKRMIDGKSLDYPAAFFTNDRVHVRRMQCTFHWDWVNRFVSAGIWQPVTLYSYDRARISDLFVYTAAIDKSSAALRIELDVEKRTSDPIRARVDVKDPNGEIVWSDMVPVHDSNVRINADIADPKLWWPVGMGDQPIYTCEATLVSADQRLDSCIVDFGIRTARIEQLQDKPNSAQYEQTMTIRQELHKIDKNGDKPGSSFTLIINGERVFCKGGNWVPADPFPSRITEERYDNLIQLAREGNINLLRCWGGGIYEPQAFWKACNKHGVMVSQDFMMSCARYPEDDPEFMDNLRVEIPQAIRMLRNHPSLVWWTGDNECGMSSDAEDAAYPGRRIANEISAPACRELDPSRMFFPTSPFGGDTNSSPTIGDSHLSGLWDPDFDFLRTDMTDYREQTKTVGRFMSESVIFGAPPKRSLMKFMAPEDILAPDRAIWEYHTKDNPYTPEGFNLTLFDQLEKLAGCLFGTTQDPDTFVKRLEYVQYEWIRLVVEAARRNKWYCSGVQFWMYNDCWPASGWSIVDYYGFPKAGWYAMKRSSQGAIASIENIDGGYRIWVCNDIHKPVRGSIDLRVQPLSGTAIWQRRVDFNVDANTSSVVAEVSENDVAGKLDSGSVLICDLAADGISDRAFYYVGMPYEMTPPPANLDVVREGNRITITSDGYARVVTLEADLHFSDNYFDMLPDETRIVTWNDPSRSKTPHEIAVTCWNAAK